MKTKDYLRRAYARRLTPNPEGGFTATIQEFPGLVAEGATIAEAYANLESAAEAWIEAVIDSGERVPDPIDVGGFSGKLALRLPRSVHKRAAEMASADGVSLNQWLVSAISLALGAAQTKREVAHSWRIHTQLNYATTDQDVIVREAASMVRKRFSTADQTPLLAITADRDDETKGALNG